MRFLFLALFLLAGYTSQSQTEIEKIDSVTVTFRTICSNSLKSSDAPLYVLNGKPISNKRVRRIDPKKIKSMELLKGEKVHALYGVRGAKGVLIIVTKEF